MLFVCPPIASVMFWNTRVYWCCLCPIVSLMFWNTRIDIDVVCVSSYSLCDVLEHQGILMLFMCPIVSLMFWNTRIDIDVVCVSSYSLCDVLEHQGILMLFVSYCLWCFGTPGYIDVFMCLNIASDFFSTRVYIYVVYVSFYSICDVLNARVYWCCLCVL